MAKVRLRRNHDPYKALLRLDQSHREHTRDEFYRALRLHAPAVMDELEQGGPPLVEPASVPTYAFAPQESWPGIAPLGPFVVRWAERHHLPTWTVIDAMDYVLSLRNGDFAGDEAPCICSDLTTPSIRGANGSVIMATVDIELPTFVWQTGHQSRAEFEAWIRARFDEELKRQLDWWEGLATGLGFRRLDRPELWRDMQRVVLRVVLGHPPADIMRIEGHPHADPHDPEHRNAQRAVTEAIAKACDLLGMPRPKRGRPPKVKSRARCIQIRKKRN